MSENIVALIQARMNSSRLPGKVLKPIAGKPMLEWVIERVRLSKKVSMVGIASTDDPSDDPVQGFARQIRCPIHRGSQFDVLDRFYQAAREFDADVIVRITADCPFIDPAVVDATIDAYTDHRVDFAANRLPPPFHRTYPIGLDTEVCSLKALERAWHEARELYEREHVMPYLYTVEGRFKTFVLQHDPDYGDTRLTVDTPEDLILIDRIAGMFGGRMDFGWLEVIHLLDQNPELKQLNAGVRHKTMVEVDERTQKQVK